MLIAWVSQLIYKERDGHTIAYARECRHLAFESTGDSPVRHVVAADYDSAVSALRRLLVARLEPDRWHEPILEDFVFTVSYCEADDAGTFSPRAALTRCMEHPVADAGGGRHV